MMKKIIKNEWKKQVGKAYVRAIILKHDVCPEGLDVERIKFNSDGVFVPNTIGGCILSVIKGAVQMSLDKENGRRYGLERGVHCFIPAGQTTEIEATSDTELISVSSPFVRQSRGKKLIIRNERFICACAYGKNSLRWILTPQYLSRRIFLHHDQVLLSKSQRPVSWFHTTMFDVNGLPENQDGLPVFKMSYNSRTEFNCCYSVKGTARVRMALHPYSKSNQKWNPWIELDCESNYLLNEDEGCAEEEYIFNKESRILKRLRNKHEVFIRDGHVSLLCMMDPAPTGVERHRSGEYSDYLPLSMIVGTPEYDAYQTKMAKYDEMMDQLSIAQALGITEKFNGTKIWERYVQGRDTQHVIEMELKRKMADEGKGRDRIIERWMLGKTGQKNGIDKTLKKDSGHVISSAPASV